MKFGVREICNVVFRAKQNQKLGNQEFKKGQPVFYIDSAKTSTVEGAATTVYATGGRGNARLIAWEGEKTLTFTVEDALLSPISFSMLSGAGLVKGTNSSNFIHFHQTSNALCGSDGTINLADALERTEIIDAAAPLYVLEVDEGGDLTGGVCDGCTVSVDGKVITTTNNYYKNKTVMVDYYVLKPGTTVSELQIDAENFAGYYYVEADTLFRRQIDGKDLPANLTLPNVKIQSNFTFSMASSGDPSTFTFTMDAFPGYTYFDNTKKVLCAIQIVDDITEKTVERDSIFKHEDGDAKVANFVDSVSASAANLDFENKGILKHNSETVTNGATIKVDSSNESETFTVEAEDQAGVTYTVMYKKTSSNIWTTVTGNATLVTVALPFFNSNISYNIKIIAVRESDEIVKDMTITLVPATSLEPGA